MYYEVYVSSETRFNHFSYDNKEKVGNSLRYLVSETKGRSTYNSEWKLMEPEGLYEITGQASI